MPYMETQDRNQMMMCSMDSMVDSERIVRIIDKFVDALALEGMGIGKAEAAAEGQPSYDPRCLLKLYLYGSRKKIRSFRRLEEACRLNQHTDEYLRQLSDMDEAEETLSGQFKGKTGEEAGSGGGTSRAL